MQFGYLLVAAALGLATLLVAEYGWHKRWWHGESARKLAHMFIAVQVAVWPLYLDWFEIRLISIALVIGFILSMQLGWFRSIGSVSRLSYGEVLFGLVIGGLTLVTNSPSIYAAAMLHLGLADGMAAIIGTRWGKMSGYRVFGATKSLVGSLAFFVVSVAILMAYSLIAPAGLAWQFIVFGAAIATALENIGVLGTDNILVPSFIVLLLSRA